MPVKYGGLGLTSVKDVASAAYLASWAHSAATLPKRFQLFGSHLNDSLGHGNVSQVRELCDLLVNHTKLQHRLSAQVFSSRVEMCLQTAGDAKDKARLRSVQGKVTGSWLEAVPSLEKLAFNHIEFDLAALLRMGCPMPFGGWLSYCECGKVLDKDGYHLLSCKHGGGLLHDFN
ncbi:uncharacterized protein LOC134198228 [Corticium candelabrum]|uniref:uncharacterized protein LOC134198228 n=1 Tax=Corticium candelabrum TaxID=121492 RepID=UPI002E26B843|nr:uncharacterized protein LOC134198228 [Corticium candelabrum]